MLEVTSQALAQACASASWAAAVVSAGPFHSLGDLVASARNAWWHQTPISGWLEAFAAHPRIGDVEGLRAKYGGGSGDAAFAAMSTSEQACAAAASDAVLQELADWNTRYDAKFGHIFIICASGKSAEEMLDAVKARYLNDPVKELQNAAIEQMKITELRLAKMFAPDQAVAELAATGSERSPITTHVLDTCLGKPAPGVHVTLARRAPCSAAAWETVASSQTNQDGRIPDLLPAGRELPAGVYRITWDTDEYMSRCRDVHPGFFAKRPFYPSVSVEFEVTTLQTREHFHVPLTWNPYGYSTYRGS